LPLHSNNVLTGTLPPSVGEGWASMRDLELGNNQFVGGLPAEWSKMTKLEILFLL